MIGCRATDLEGKLGRIGLANRRYLLGSDSHAARYVEARSLGEATSVARTFGFTGRIRHYGTLYPTRDGFI